MLVALAGGGGGAKLAQGLYLALPPERMRQNWADG